MSAGEIGANDIGLHEALRKAAGSLGRNGNPKEFSAAAGAKILELNAEYLADITEGSIANARRQRQDAVSASHVLAADATLRVPHRRARTQVLNAGGGVTLGAGLSQVGVALMATNQTQLAYLIALGFIGLSVVLFGLARYLH
jgi:hypothetical protein